MNYYNEWDARIAAWLRELIKRGLIPMGEVDERSIKDVQPADLKGYTQCHFFAGIGGWPLALQLAGWDVDRPVWTGSCPCQPFSCAGKGKGFEDERHLLPELIRLIDACRPESVFGEQAPSMEWLDAATDAMEGINYSVWPQVRRADSVGLFQERRRLYWAATDATSKRQQKQGNNKQNTVNSAKAAIREASGIVSAFRRKTLPFLCSSHNGIPARVGELCCSGFGNAIVHQVAAIFIQAYEERLA